MKIYDITVPLSRELPVYPGDPPLELVSVASLSRGADANVTRLTITTHSGTHIDSPSHVSSHGISVDHLPLTILLGRALVVEILGVKEIGRRELARLPLAGEERLLLKTGNSLLWNRPGFCEEYCHLTMEAAHYLSEVGIKLVGIDYLSIERLDGGGAIHRHLLGNGVIILEGVNLEGVPAGSYELICLPLKIKGGDGAPVRAVLRRREGVAASAEFDPHTSKWPLA